MSTAGVASRPRAASPGTPNRDGDRDSILVYLSLAGEVFPMRVLASDPVASVKLRIHNRRGFLPGRQRLVFAGRELARNGSPVGDYGVADGNVLHLVLRLADLLEVRVSTACGRAFDLRVDRGRNVGFLRSELARRAQGVLDLRGHHLLCGGEELEDSRAVGDICRGSDSVIHLLAREPVEVRRKVVGRELELLVLPVEPDESSSPNPPVLEPIIVNPKAKLSPELNDLVLPASAGLDKGNSPVRSAEGSGGAYFMRDESNSIYVGVFKPMDEESMAVNNPQGLPPSDNGQGLKRGTLVGKGALREVAAYLLDHPSSGRRSPANCAIGFSGVPPTVMVRCQHGAFNYPEGVSGFKIGSLQRFVPNDGTCEDMGPKFFPVQEVHKISVLDIRLANADRHGGNVLVCREGQERRIVLVPIDHGYCLPESFEDCTFEWLYWPQVRERYDSETVEYVRSLDAEEDIALLKFHGWELSVECARTIRISTMLLKKGVERGLTSFTIGSILCRETIKKKSVIEEIVDKAEASLLPGSSDEAAFMELVSEIMDRCLDELTQ